MSQGANIFGFGGHRALGISGNNGGIGMSGTDNVIIGNERVGLDSGLGIGQGQGLNLGSMLQFGNSPNPMHPSGHMGNFLDNIKNFFASLIPQPAPPPPPPMPLPPRRHRPRPTQQPPGELWENTSEEPDAWAPERMTSRSPLEVVLPSRPHRISTEGGVGPGSSAGARQSCAAPEAVSSGISLTRGITADWSRGYVARPPVADRGLIADQKRPCACPEAQVDSGDGLPVSAEPGLTHDILVSRKSVWPKACNQVTGRCKGGGLESPPTNKLH
ncbi:hypothetical protein RB195_019209 [Necator americanus]|uniref:Uncharacterized protein n=1 Tax=Necator americanus TaxID=51031 RepID=A0ABR1CFD2_NECAM